MGIKSTRSRSLGKLLNAWRSIDVTGNGPIINSSFRTDRFQPAAMNASGGTKVVVGSDTWHIFYGGPEDGPNIFTLTEGPTGPGGTCEILVLGGGGGGGYFYVMQVVPVVLSIIQHILLLMIIHIHVL